jgi:hypothetical protein
MEQHGGGFASSRRPTCAHHHTEHSRGRYKQCPAPLVCPKCPENIDEPRICEGEYSRMYKIVCQLGVPPGPTQHEQIKQMQPEVRERLRRDIQRLYESPQSSQQQKE